MKALRILGAVLIILALAAYCGRGVVSDNPPTHFSDVQMGMTIPQVITILGQPDDRQHTEAAGNYNDDCLYYGNAQICFENGHVVEKATY